ncbi:unnamed protein product [Adineta steineri]|uniref:Apple domain-containing protein n=1 Tax=Adineta steineri TaxID=433720 RepID=A0A814HR16_9BILA|nr:unnamed protein product [Adineta steineri]CAF1371406.1 unnamed protein product [Adineta steineri]CAF1372438.1 unnamed protein product [Adineta steineri]
MRVLSGICVITVLFSIQNAETYSLENFDNSYSQRDASVFYIRQLLKRIKSNHDASLQWRKRTDDTPKKCQEIKLGQSYIGVIGASINNITTYQDCINQCEKDSKCYGWSYKNSSQRCWLQTSLGITNIDKSVMGGSCLGPAAKETHCTDVIISSYYNGDSGPAITQVATYQDCMRRCDASATCLAWRHRASDNTCWLQTTAYEKITDGQYTSGSCIKQQTQYPSIGTVATPKKCKEIKSGFYYGGDTGSYIDNITTYQDCMNWCEKDSQCYGWLYYNSTNHCLPQTSVDILYTDESVMGGSCLGPAAKETHCKEVISNSSHIGTIDRQISRVTTYQGCMTECDASPTCMGWAYQASGQICQLLTTIRYTIPDKQYTTGSCIKKQTPYAPLSLEKFRQQALDQHNFYRKKHCTPPLVLDPALNDIAQSYAEHLAAIDTYVHSGTRFNGQWMGENLSGLDGRKFSYDTGAAPTNSWYNEIQSYNWSNPGIAKATGHFTQLIWKDTTRLGIGRARSNTSNTVFVVGNYFPGGNLPGQFEKNALPLC